MRILFIGFLVLGSCATTHNGKTTLNQQKNLVVSCEQNFRLSNADFLMLSCTFENVSGDWLSVSFQEVKFKESIYKVSSAEDIRDFIKAYGFELQKRDHNTGVLLAGLVVAGAVVAASSNSNTAAGAGGASAAAAVTVGLNANESHPKTQYHFGENHILGSEFRLPPKLFVRRNLLIERSQLNVVPKSFQLCASKPDAECFKIHLNYYKQRRKRAYH